MHEYEVKFLNIDPANLEKKLAEIGAKKEFEQTYKRIIFDYPDLRLDGMGAFIRLRDEGNQITLAYKQRLEMGMHNGNDGGMLEHEVVVSDFEETAQIFRRTGFVEKFYQENKRIRYSLEGINFEIDQWPLIPPYLEIEGKSWDEVARMIEILGFREEDKKICTTTQVYASYNINDLDFKVLTFDRQEKRNDSN